MVLLALGTKMSPVYVHQSSEIQGTHLEDKGAGLS